MKTFFLFLGVFILCFVIISVIISSDEKEIKQWATEKGMEVKNIDMHVTPIGTPFYYVNKGSHIYEVDMTNGEKWWVRTGLFGNDYEKEK